MIHIIGERPGTEHSCFSAYLVYTDGEKWKQGVDHDIAKVVCGIAKDSLNPVIAAKKVVKILASQGD